MVVSDKPLLDDNGHMTEHGIKLRDIVVRMLDRKVKDWVCGGFDPQTFSYYQRENGYISDIDSIFTVCADAVQKWYEKAKERENAN